MRISNRYPLERLQWFGQFGSPTGDFGELPVQRIQTCAYPLRREWFASLFFVIWKWLVSIFSCGYFQIKDSDCFTKLSKGTQTWHTRAGKMNVECSQFTCNVVDVLLDRKGKLFGAISKTNGEVSRSYLIPTSDQNLLVHDHAANPFWRALKAQKHT